MKFCNYHGQVDWDALASASGQWPLASRGWHRERSKVRCFSGVPEGTDAIQYAAAGRIGCAPGRRLALNAAFARYVPQAPDS